MRMTLCAVAALVALAGARPATAYAWHPWCAQYADRSGNTDCLFNTFQQCLATVSGIGGSCVQNWYPAPAAPPHKGHWKNFYR